MKPATGHDEHTAKPAPASLWMGVPGWPALPNRAISALELEGYLTGIIVAPSPIRPSLWMAGALEDEPVCEDMIDLQSMFHAIALMFNALSTTIDRSLQRLEAERICDYRPAFLPAEGKPPLDAVRIWTQGFWRAMALAPEQWIGLIADERLGPIIAPLVGFALAGYSNFEPTEHVEGPLDNATETIPLTILLLRKLGQLRASHTSVAGPMRRMKIGRNNPCPCGSGKKYKRCCGLS